MLGSISTVLLHHSMAFFQFASLDLWEAINSVSTTLSYDFFLRNIESYLLKENFSIIHCTKLLFSANAFIALSFSRVALFFF